MGGDCLVERKCSHADSCQILSSLLHSLLPKLYLSSWLTFPLHRCAFSRSYLFKNTILLIDWEFHTCAQLFWLHPHLLFPLAVSHPILPKLHVVLFFFSITHWVRFMLPLCTRVWVHDWRTGYLSGTTPWRKLGSALISLCSPCWTVDWLDVVQVSWRPPWAGTFMHVPVLSCP